MIQNKNTNRSIVLNSRPVTHRFKLCEIMKAYDTFENASLKHALKVIVTNV